MLHIESIVSNTDNSGIIRGKILHIYNTANKKTPGFITNKVLIASQKTDIRKQPKKKMTQALITKIKKNTKRKNGHYIKFGKAGIVVLYENDAFKGTKIKGPLAAELKYQTINTDILTTVKAIV